MIWRNYVLLALTIGILDKVKVGYGQTCTQQTDETRNTDSGEPHFTLTWDYTPSAIEMIINDPVNGDVVTRLDNGPPDFSYDFPIGTTTVFAVDVTEVSCSFTVTVIDNEDPVIVTCPMDVSVMEPDKVVWDPPTFSDNSGIVTIEKTGGVTLDTRPTMGGMVTYVAKDPSDRLVTCSFMVTVIGNSNVPQIDGCPPREVGSDNTLRVTAQFGQTMTSVSWTEPQPTQPSQVTRTSLNRNEGSSFIVGSTYVIYRFNFNDDRPLTAECAFYVIVSSLHDEEPPTVTCPDSFTVVGDVNSDTTVVSWDAITPTDNRALRFFEFIPQSGTSFGNGVTTVNYFATDTSFNEARCQFTVTVIEFTDNDNPVIENCPSDFTFFTNDGQPQPQVTWSPPTVFDASQWTLTEVRDLNPPVVLAVRETPYTIQYVAVDIAGNMATCTFEITVGYDDVNPSVTCPGSVTEYVIEADRQIPVSLTWEDPPNFFSDNSGEVTVMKSHNPGVFVVPGDQVIVMYTARDRFDNIDACTFTLSVIVDPAPVFMFCESESTTLTTDANQNSRVYSWNVPTDLVTDVNPESGGSTTTTNTATPSTITPPYQFPLGVTSIVYTATDSRGSTSTCTVTVTVVDMQTPQFTGCPGTDQSFSVFNSTFRSAVVTWNVPVVQDNTGTVTVTSNISPGAILPVGNYVVRYVALDNAGNSGTCIFNVIVQDLPGDDSGPLIAGCPADLNENTDPRVDYTTVAWAVPTVTDIVDPNPNLIASHNPGDRFFIGTTTVTYTAIDDSGNMAVCNFQIVIRDGESPEFDSCPPNIERFVDMMATQALAKVSEVTATDNSGTVIFLDNFQYVVMLSDSPIQRVLGASDPSGNVRTCTVTITLTPTSEVLVYPGQIVVTQFGGSIVVPTDFGDLERDLNNLFRCSALADDFVGIRITGSNGFTFSYELSLYNGNVANPYSMRGREISRTVETEFVNALTGTPPRLFDTGNEVQVDSFQLTVCEFRGSFTLVSSEGSSTDLNVNSLIVSGSVAEGLLAQRILLRLDSIYENAVTISTSYITSVVILPFERNAIIPNSIIVDFVLVFSAETTPPTETLVNQEFTDEIQFNAAEELAEIGNSGLFIDSAAAVSIVKICPTCLNGGSCIISDRLVPSCVCIAGFSGVRCEIRPPTLPPIIPTVVPTITRVLSDGALVGIIAGAALLLLLLLLLLALCCCCFLLGTPKGPPIAGPPIHYEEPALYHAPPRPRAIAYSAPPSYAQEPYVEMIVPEAIPNQSAMIAYGGYDGYDDYRRGPLIEEIDSYPAYKRDYLHGPYF